MKMFIEYLKKKKRAAVQHNINNIFYIEREGRG